MWLSACASQFLPISDQPKQAPALGTEATASKTAQVKPSGATQTGEIEGDGAVEPIKSSTSPASPVSPVSPVSPTPTKQKSGVPIKLNLAETHQEPEMTTSLDTSKPDRASLSQLQMLHFKVQFKTRSLIKLNDWDSTQLQVLNNYNSSLFWMGKLIQSGLITREDIKLMTLNLQQLRQSIYHIRDLSQRPSTEEAHSDNGLAGVQATIDLMKEKNQPQGNTSEIAATGISWAGRFTEIQNRAKVGYNWKQLRDPLSQVERSALGPALADQILAVKKMVQKRDRKEIAHLVFNLEVDLDSGKWSSAEIMVRTLEEDYPDYQSEFDLVKPRARIVQLKKNLQAPRAPTQDATQALFDILPPQIKAVELSKADANTGFAKADQLLKESKWLQTRDVMLPWVNSNYRDDVSSRIHKASEAYCKEKRSEAAKYMARARGRGRSRQKLLYAQALAELEQCAHEFPGSAQANTVQNNIKMLKSRI